MNSLKAYTLFSSSKGNSSYITYGSTSFLIDAGGSLKSISEKIAALGGDVKKLSGVFISHEHADHTKGLEVLSKKHGIPIYTHPKCMDVIGMTAPSAEGFLVPTEAGDTVYMGDLKVTVYPTPHDSVRSFCYRVESPKGSLGYATDIGHISDSVQDAIFGCDKVLIESNHDIDMLKSGPYPEFLKERILGRRGHLSNGACACVAPVLARCGSRSITLAHLSETNNTPRLAYGAVKEKLEEYGVKLCGECFAGDVVLKVASPAEITEI